MRKCFIILVIIGLAITACSSGPETEAVISDTPLPATDTPLPPTETANPPTATATEIPPTATQIPPTATSTPTKKPIQKRVQFQTVDQLIGTWKKQRVWDLLDIYLRFNPDGTFEYARRSLNLLDTEPAVKGEWWFEDGMLHVRDLERQGDETWEECGQEIIGIYIVTLEPQGNIAIKSKTDECSCYQTTENCRRERMNGPFELVEP